MIVYIGVENLHGAAAKIWREIEIKIMEHRARENRPRAAQQETIVTVIAAILKKCPAVRLQDAMQLRDEIGIRRAENETVRAQRKFRLRLGELGGRLLIILPLPLQNLDFLIQRLNLGG